MSSSRMRVALVALIAVANAGCKETLVFPIAIDAIELTPTAVVLEVTDHASLEAVLRGVAGETLSQYPIEWSSEDPSVAIVDDNGVIEAVAVGQTNIVARVGDVTARAAVDVARMRWLTLSRSTIEFHALVGAANPKGESVQIGAGGAGGVTNLGLSATYAAGEPLGWLQAELSAGSTPAVLNLAVKPGSAKPGIYTATVDVASSQAETKSLTVRLHVTSLDQPIIQLSPATIEFTSAQNGADPSASTVLVTNAGSGSLQNLTAAKVGAAASWLDVSLNQPDAPAVITLAPHISGLAPGVHETAVLVSAAGGINATLPVRVEIVAQNAAVMNVDPSSLSFSVVQGQPDPSPTDVHITNGGGGTLSGVSAGVSYGAGQPGGWLTTSLNSTTAPATLTVGAMTSALAPGTYNASLQVTSSNAPSRLLPVQLVVSGSTPIIQLNVGNVSFQATTGGASPAPAQVQVTNGGAGTLDGLGASVSYGAGQPTGWLAANLGGSDAPTSLGLTASVGSLPPGTYDATIAVTSPSAADVNLPVQFTVDNGSPTIQVSSGSVTFDATSGGGNPSPVDVQITNGGSGSLSGVGVSVAYGGGQPTGWLQANLSGSSAPAALTLAATTGSLTAGSYQATAHLTAPGAAPVDVGVSFTVQSGATPIITVGVPTVILNADAGGSATTPVDVSITNGGGGSLAGLGTSITYGNGQPTGWLQANLSATTAPATLSVQADPASLGAGLYTATINVTSSVASTVSINVSLVVTALPVPIISLSVPAVPFVAISGGVTTPPSASILISNLGLGTLSGLSASVSFAQGQPNGWLQASLQATTAPTTLQLTASAAGLAPGLYSATVSVQAQGAVAINLGVTIAVVPAVTPVIGLSTGSVTFTGVAGGPNPVSQPVSITNIGILVLAGLSAQVNYGAGQPTGWLSTGLSSSTAPSTLTLNTNIAGLAPGAYSAEVVVTGLLATPRSFYVGLVISASAPPSMQIVPR